MSTFNATIMREQLDGEIGIRRYLAKSFDEAHEHNALTPMSDAMLLEAIRCLLVGYDEAAQNLLSKSHDWLSSAIADEERPRYYFPGGTEAARFGNLALCNWLLNGVHDANSLSKAVHYQDIWFSQNGVDKKFAWRCQHT